MLGGFELRVRREQMRPYGVTSARGAFNKKDPLSVCSSSCVDGVDGVDDVDDVS